MRRRRKSRGTVTSKGSADAWNQRWNPQNSLTYPADPPKTQGVQRVSVPELQSANLDVPTSSVELSMALTWELTG